MKVRIRDRETLLAVPPAALSAYARAAGWARTEPYGDHSDVYAGEGLPEIILPRTQRLGDYAGVVSQLVDIFAKTAGTDELSLYRGLMAADRDVLRLRAAETDAGHVAVSDGIDLMGGARDMILAAACSLQDPQPLYRKGENKEAADYVRRIGLGQTEQGSFIVTLLLPAASPSMRQPREPDRAFDGAPVERRMTKRLVEALRAARQAIERRIAGDTDAFFEAVEQGVSANLCKALAKLIQPFPALDVSVTWACTHPTATTTPDVVHFLKADAPILREAARSFRSYAPQPDMRLTGRLTGTVQKLERNEKRMQGAVTLRTSIDNQDQSVLAVLNPRDYEQAIQAHREEAPIVMAGDLKRSGKAWRLLNPRIVDAG